MDKDSMLIFKTPSSKSPSIVQCSPGNNPFDDLLKKTIDTATMTDWQNRRSSLQLSGNFSDFGRQSLSFHELNPNSFGRESIGILPPDFGRDSLGFMNITNSEINRDSLGILQINALRESLSFRRESLGILNLTDIGRESLDCGRESLGILYIKSPDVKFGNEDKNIPDIILTTIEENSDYKCNPLDTAFLNTCSRMSLGTSSTVSSITPSFNSCSLEEPSRIYSSFVKGSNNKSNILNQGFINDNTDEYSNSVFLSMSSIHSPLNKGRLSSPSDLSVRSRIQSLPVTIEENCEFSNDATDFEFTDKKFWTTNATVKTKLLKRRSFHGTLDFGDTSNEFPDSVFIEGQLIAEKIADGSILNDSCGSEIGILDCTPQPNWPDDLSYSEEEKDVKCNKETVFKTVDKMLPPPTQDNKFKLKISKTDSNSSNENHSDKSNISNISKSFQYSENDSKLIQNISNITRDSDKYSVSHSASKDAKEIIHKLSEILNCTHSSDQQLCEGQNLLSSLADMLSENNSNTKPEDPDDSGHSSINEQCGSPKKDDHKCFEVLDLRTKSGSEDVSKDETANKNATLDLSLKSKSKENAGKRLTQSFSSRKSIPLNVAKKKNASTISLDINKNRSVSVNSSVNSNNSKSVDNTSRLSIAGKLRPKTVNQSMKKGPMKAIIPIGDMKKRCSLPVTPERPDQRSATMQSKRTSTPINEPKLKPMAASTPASHPEKDRTNLRTTSLPRFKKIEDSPTSRNKANTPTSLPRTLNMESKFLRRNSVSEIKKTESVSRKIKRSNSVESESGLMSSLAKVRQNIINTPYYQLKRASTLKESNSIETGNKTNLNRSKGLPVGKTANSAKSKITSNGYFVGDRLFTTSKQKEFGSSKIEKDKNDNLIPTKLPFTTHRSVGARRSSVSDIKKLPENPIKLQRSNSFGKVTGIMSSLAKIRQNILSSPFNLRN